MVQYSIDSTNIAPNSLKPSPCTRTHQKLSKKIRSAVWSAMVWEISAWPNKIKQNVNLMATRQQATGSGNEWINKYPKFIMGLLAQDKNGDKQFWK